MICNSLILEISSVPRLHDPGAILSAIRFPFAMRFFIAFKARLEITPLNERPSIPS